MSGAKKMMDYNKVILKNAHIFDPDKGIDNCEGNLYIRGNRIADEPFEADAGTRIVDLSGYLVLPGLIDFHTHLNFGGSDVGLLPDLMLLPNGVTSAVDAGTCGVSNFESFSRYTIASSLVTIKSLLYTANAGIPAEDFVENTDPVYFNLPRILHAFEQFSDEIIGLKIRIGKAFSDNLDSLHATIKIAEEVGCIVGVHMVDLPCSYEEVLPLLRPGDSVIHPFQHKGVTVLDENKRIRQCVIDAQKRGVMLDLACARYNWSFEILQQAIKQEVYPDFIGTDLCRINIYERPLFSLPYVMSTILAAGMPFDEVVKRSTTFPARKMGLEGLRGTLTSGSYADIAVFKVIEKEMVFTDKLGYTLHGEKLLSPKMTIKDGRILYQCIEI